MSYLIASVNKNAISVNINELISAVAVSVQVSKAGVISAWHGEGYFGNMSFMRTFLIFLVRIVLLCCT
jgi:hypothetical protein